MERRELREQGEEKPEGFKLPGTHQGQERGTDPCLYKLDQVSRNQECHYIHYFVSYLQSSEVEVSLLWDSLMVKKSKMFSMTLDVYH